jgi:hypothetical protein
MDLQLNRFKSTTWTVVAILSVLAAGVLFFFAPEEYGFYPRCVFHALTGLQCPGCGGLRAAHHLLHGEIATAFAFNPLLVLAAPVALFAALNAFICKALGWSFPGFLKSELWLWSLLIVSVAFAVLRNVAPHIG